VDETKLVERLGDRTPLPLEVVPFGAEAVIERLAALEARPELRRRDGKPFVTDNGNYIVDCHFAVITDPAALEARLAAIVGVVESGLFLGLASKVIVGTRHGVEEIAP
jgi:ribose 5-phosphate isomerase A